MATDKNFVIKNGLTVGTSEIITSAGNLTNVGTISSGAITSTGTLKSTNATGLILDTGAGYRDVQFVLTGNTGNGTLEIIPMTVPGSGTASYTTHFKNFVATGTTRHDLKVDGNATFTGTISSGAITSSGNVVLDAAGHNYIELHSATANTRKWRFYNGQSWNPDALLIYDQDADATVLTIETGKLGINRGAGSLSHTLDVGGNIAISGTEIISSSRNFTNIGTISSGAITLADGSHLQTYNTNGTTGTGGVDLPRGGHITFYGNNANNHSIGSRNNTGAVTDDLRISSYGAVYFDLDSNSNNESAADFVIGRHGNGTGTMSTLVTISGEDGSYTSAGTINSGAITSTGAIQGASFSDGTISGITFIDEDSFSTNSATRVPTQQSIKAYVDAEVAGIVDSSPAALNTLNELAAALGDDANFSTTTSTSLGNRLRVDTAAQGLTGTQQANAITNLGITAIKAELNYVDGVTSNIQTQLNGKLSTSGTAVQANNLNAIDDRDIAPEDLGYADDFRIYFGEKGGLETGTIGANYQDVLVLNSYSDASGGDANALAFDKSEKKIYHYQADQTATNWGTPKTIAYIDDNITGTAAGLSGTPNITVGTISSGAITSTGHIQSAGALKVTETGTAQVIMIGNQDSGGTDKPAMIMGVNGIIRIGHGSSWSSEGGTFSEKIAISGNDLKITSGGLILNATTVIDSSRNLTNIASLNGIAIGNIVREDTSNEYPTYSNVNTFHSNTSGASTGANQSSLQVYQSTAQADAFMAFHVGSDYAGYFGLDGATNDLFWGGWSVGAVKNRIWHAGNDSTLLKTGANISVGTISSGEITTSGNVNINTAADGLYFSGGNNRIYFTNNRAIEGATDGSNLQIAEGYNNILAQAHVNISSTHTLQMNGTTVIDASRNLTNINITKFRDHGSSFYASPTNSNTLNAGYSQTGDTADIWINYRGYQDGTSYFRDFRIGDGKNVGLLFVDGSSGEFQFGYNSKSTNINLVSGNYQVNSTTVIDSSRNLTNIGTISGGKTVLTGTGSTNTYSGLLKTVNTSSDQWGHITLGGSATNSVTDNYYLIGRGSSVSAREMSFHIPTDNNYGDSTQPIFRFACSGEDTLMTITSQTGAMYVKGTISSGAITAPKLYINNGTTYGVGIVNGNSARFDTVDSGNSNDPLELCYYNGNGVRIGPNGGDLYLSAGSIQITGTTVISSGRAVTAVSYGAPSGTTALYNGYNGVPMVQGVNGAAYYHGSDNGGYGIVIQGGHPICKSVKIGSVNAGTTVIDGSRNITCVNFQNTGGSKIEVQDSVDGGNTRGIFMWNTGDPNWGFYMSTAGSGKSLAAGTACSGLDGRTSHGIRYRVADSTTQIGHIFENANDEALFQIQPDTGNIFARGNVTAYASDARLKTNIQTIKNPIEKIKKIRGVEFDWIDNIEETHQFKPKCKRETGVIAQEIEAVIPDAISPAPFNNEYKTVEKDKIVALLIEAIKEQQEQIDELKQEVTSLSSKI